MDSLRQAPRIYIDRASLIQNGDDDGLVQAIESLAAQAAG